MDTELDGIVAGLIGLYGLAVVIVNIITLLVYPTWHPAPWSFMIGVALVLIAGGLFQYPVQTLAGIVVIFPLVVGVFGGGWALLAFSYPLIPLLGLVALATRP